MLIQVAEKLKQLELQKQVNTSAVEVQMKLETETCDRIQDIQAKLQEEKVTLAEVQKKLQEDSYAGQCLESDIKEWGRYYEEWLLIAMPE